MCLISTSFPGLVHWLWLTSTLLSLEEVSRYVFLILTLDFVLGLISLLFVLSWI